MKGKRFNGKEIEVMKASRLDVCCTVTDDEHRPVVKLARVVLDELLQESKVGQ